MSILNVNFVGNKAVSQCQKVDMLAQEMGLFGEVLLLLWERKLYKRGNIG